ncbi:MAG TPA: ZIP family metal transporter [Sandaracinaceae bacterium LLY-WYZ-13_1]|nr:ZIP family metal transporter [Sandaracinaceae bacterium LLY-WYZ-13_1]
MLALVAALLAAVVTAAGIAAARRRHALVRRGVPWIVAFAAGVLVTAALAHLLPHALAERSDAPLWALGGFVAMVGLSRLGAGHVCHEDAATRGPAGWLAPSGIGLHSFLDGLTYAVAFDAGHVSGATVATGMILHELPEGLISYALLVRSGLSPRRAALLAWLVAGVTTPAGALVAMPILDVLASGLRAVLVALSGGVLLFVGAAHLLPQTDRGSRWNVLAFAGGVLLAVGTTLAHHHG